MKIESSRRTAGCGRRLEEGQQKRRCTNTGIVCNCVTGAWKQISKQRQLVNVSYDPRMVTALRQTNKEIHGNAPFAALAQYSLACF